MIQVILNLLVLDDFYGVSDTVDIAKGKYKIHSNLKDGLKQAKRIWKRKR